MMWTSIDTWIVAVGALSAMSCAILGNYLILRQMSMMGDAISHAVLPGLAIAFLVTGSRSSLPMFIGAALVGILTVFFTQSISHLGKVEKSASMGVVFTTLFAIGLILIVKAADTVDLDPGCVLYGAIELTPLDTIKIGGMIVPRVILPLAIIFIVNLCFVIFFYKELKISSFDPALSTTLGINANLMHYLLMTMVAITTVASFESVGSILVIAMLIVPGAVAYIITNKLSIMILLSIIISVMCSVLGHLSAITVPSFFGFSDTNTAGMMGVVAGIFFSIALFFSPQGILSRFINKLKININITSEDILGMLYRLESIDIKDSDKVVSKLLYKAKGTGRILFWLAVTKLKMRKKIINVKSNYKLTENGLRQASNLIRAHRLWESYIYKHLNIPAEKVHFPAHQLEHITNNSMQSYLIANVENTDFDPHGKKIPNKQ